MLWNGRGIGISTEGENLEGTKGRNVLNKGPAGELQKTKPSCSLGAGQEYDFWERGKYQVSRGVLGGLLSMEGGCLKHVF